MIRFRLEIELTYPQATRLIAGAIIVFHWLGFL